MCFTVTLLETRPVGVAIRSAKYKKNYKNEKISEEKKGKFNHLNKRFRGKNDQLQIPVNETGYTGWLINISAPNVTF